MTDMVCKYHPTIPARWECSQCLILFCADCVKLDAVRNEARCPVCKEKLEQMSAANFVVPFWKRLPKFFLYPANMDSLIFILISSIVIPILFAVSPIFSFIIIFVFLLGFIRYSMLILEYTSQGNLKPPEVGLNLFTEGLGLSLKQIIVFALMGYAINKAAELFGIFAGIMTAVFIILAIPASIVVLAIDKSLFKAINPFALVSIMQRIGAPYLVLYIFLILLSSSHAAISEIISKADFLALIPVQFGVSMYFTLIMYNMMGYVIFQYHEAIDYRVRMDVKMEYGEKSNKTTSVKEPALVEADILVKEGKQEEAIKLLKGEICKIRCSSQIQDYYYKLIHQFGSEKEILEYGRNHINVLLASHNYAKAVEVYEQCFKIDKSFKPSDPDKYFQLAMLLMEKRQYTMIVNLVNGFHVTYAGHKQIPKLYLMVAKVLYEKLNKEKKALQVLNFLKSAYPEHEYSQQIAAYIETVTRLMATNSKSSAT